MADEQKPGGSEAAPPPGSEAAGQPAKPAAEAPKPAPPKPSAPKPAPPPPKPPATMAATPWESDLARDLKEGFGEAIGETSTYLGQNFIVAKPGSAIPILEYQIGRAHV